MREITDIDELRQIELDLLKTVHSFCKERNIRCYLGGGTLLGAVRHKGFIPWDDDIDVGMPRPDYERFCREFSAPHASVHCFKNDPEYFLPFAKVYDDRTVAVEDRDPDGREAVFVDVFPIDGISDRDIAAKTIPPLLRRCMAFLSLRRAPPLFRCRAIAKQLALWAGAPLRLIPLPLRKRMARRELRRLDDFVSAAGFDDAPFACCAVSDFSPRKIVPKKIFEPGPELPFEDGTFSVMAGWHDHLESLYGDFMKLPPPEKRMTHHTFRAWWKDGQPK